MKNYYTFSEVNDEINVLKNTFTNVRLVNPIENVEYIVFNNLNDIKCASYSCFSMLGKRLKCKTCISLKCLQTKKMFTKFEFINDDIYYIMAKYVNIEGIEASLEMIIKIDNSTLLDGYGYNKFIDKITKYNEDLYLDELTCVYNRKYLNSNLPSLISENINKGSNLGLAIVDVDYFKLINDSGGHPFGDKVLCTIADFLKSNISSRRGDFVVRLGGDEFLIVLNNIDYNVYIKRLTEIINKSRKIQIDTDDNKLKISLSIGAAFSGEIDVPTIDNLISLADERMYFSKKKGRNYLTY